MSAALRFSFGPTSLAVEPRSIRISPDGTGALLGCHVVIWVGSSSSTLRRRRAVFLRCDPRGPPPGPPRCGAPRPGPPAPGAPAPGPPGPPAPGPPGPPVRGPLKPPPGREGPPVRGAPVVGRGPPVRGPVGAPGRPPVLGIGRRAPGGGGIGRPVALIGRPGGGGIGRPVELIGGRCGCCVPSVGSALDGRCVGRIVTGPSGETVRVGAAFGAAARLRTTFGASSASVSAGAGATGATSASTSTALVTRNFGAGFSLAPSLGAGSTTASVAFVAFVALVAFVAFVAFTAFGSSGTTSRRRPSASALRRMRSACASSIEAEGLVAPIPSFWARPSNSLLVSPSSLESSCTRIFFCAKTIL